MRGSPQEDHGEQHDRRDADRSGDRRPANKYGEAPSRAADHDVRGGPPLQADRVHENVEQDGGVGERRRDPVDADTEEQRRQRPEHDAEYERFTRPDNAAVGERAARGTPHDGVDVASR